MGKRIPVKRDGKVVTFMVPGERNPCGCGSNCFHQQYDVDEDITYGVCNACRIDIYTYKKSADPTKVEYHREGDKHGKGSN